MKTWKKLLCYMILNNIYNALLYSIGKISCDYEFYNSIYTVNRVECNMCYISSKLQRRVQDFCHQETFYCYPYAKIKTWKKLLCYMLLNNIYNALLYSIGKDIKRPWILSTPLTGYTVIMCYISISYRGVYRIFLIKSRFQFL